MAQKRSDTCTFLGSGSSINRITPEQWRLISQTDIWAVNNWVYHPSVVPNFYHIEVKHYNYELIQKRLLEKRDAYKNVHFLFQHGKKIKVSGVRRPLHQVTFAEAEKYRYYLQARDPKRTHKPLNANYTPAPKLITKSYDMSVTSVLEMIWRFGYKTVVLCGVDLYDSLYFWTGGDLMYGEVHHQTNKAHEDKDPAEPHACHRIKDFIVDFDRRWMRPKNRNLFVLNQDSALYPEVRLA